MSKQINIAETAAQYHYERHIQNLTQLKRDIQLLQDQIRINKVERVQRNLARHMSLLLIEQEYVESKAWSWAQRIKEIRLGYDRPQ